MELSLTLQSNTQVAVAVDGQPSHTFDLRQVVPDEKDPGRPPQPLDDPVAYGEAVYRALFAPNSLAERALDGGPERLMLVAVGCYLGAILVALWAVQPRPYRRYRHNLTEMKKTLEQIIVHKSRALRLAGLLFWLGALTLAALVVAVIFGA